MTKRNKTILFFVCLILFFIIAPTVIFYSQGYRFDFIRKKITQTGGFYFKILPKNSEIYLNDRFKKKTDFFIGEAQLGNLLPRKYKVEIKKPGFHSWQKTLEVKERQVTEAKNIVLFPENVRFNLLDKGIEDFFILPDEKKIVLKRKQGKSLTLELFDPEKNSKDSFFKEKDISPSLPETKGELKISDENIFLTKNNALYKFNFETNSFEKFFEPIKGIKPSPDKKRLVYFSEYEVWILYLAEEISPFHKKNESVFLLRFSEKIEDIFWLTNHYLLIQTNGKIKISEIDDRDRINIILLAEFKNPKIFWSAVNRKLYLLDEGSFLVSEKLF